MTQEKAFEIFKPDLTDFGKVYKKYGLVQAIYAPENITIETWTFDGLETTNTSKQNDMLVRNLQTEWQECYLVPENKFFDRYILFYNTECGSIYIPKGKIVACMYLGQDCSFYAPWGKLMMLKTGDYIASPYPQFDEVYRIAAKEFQETYKLDDLN